MMKHFLVFVTIWIGCSSFGQDSSRLFLNTGAGVVKVNAALHHVLKPTVAFNSALELETKKNWLAQFTLDFNSLKYDQHISDENSDILFQHTNSSLLIIGLNGGKNFTLGNTWLTSAYAGSGFASIGEPRVTVQNNIATQTVKRMNSGFGRAGFRLAKEKIKFLQTVYLDGSWWYTPLHVQGYRLTGFSFYIGTKMAMGK